MTTGTRPIVGRRREVAAVTAALQGLGRAARFIALSGEPGIGKTRLLEELGRRAEERGCVVLTGTGAELERDLPFGVWVDALDDHVAWLGPDRVRRMLGDRVAELARVLPAVEPGDAAPAPALQDERYRAHRAVRTLLERLAAAAPVVIVLDDVQWADDSSLELMAHLLRRPPQAPLLVAAAFRSGGLAPAVLAALEAAGRDGRVEDLRLAPLSAGEAGALLGEHLPVRVRDELFRLAGGNPFYLEQLARGPRPTIPMARGDEGEGAAARGEAGGAAARGEAGGAAARGEAGGAAARGEAGGAAARGEAGGAVAREEDGVPTAPMTDGAGEVGVPRAVAAALGQEIAALGAPARMLLQGAAVAGDPAELGLAAHAGDVPDDALAAALDELVASGLMGPGELPRRYRFRHPIVRSAVYEATGEGWRLGAHGRAAAELERIDGPLAARAHHLERSAAPGDDTAIAVLGQAGHAAAPTAPAEAARWFAGALRLLPAEDGRRLEYLLPLATSLAATGRLEEALATLQDVLALVPPAMADIRARLVAGCAACENLLGRHGAAHQRLSTALDELPDRSSAAAVALQAELAVDALYDSDFAALAHAAERASTTAKALGEPALLAFTGALECFAHYGLGRLDAAEAARTAAAAALDGLDDGQLAARLEAPYYLGFAEFLCERFDDAIAHLRRGLAVSRAVGQGQFVVPMTVGLAHALEVRGQLEEALDTAEGGVEAGRLSGNRQVLSWALVGEGWVAAMAGDLERAAAAAEEAVALLAGLQDSVLTLATHGLAATIFLEAGDLERCFAEAARAGAPDFARIEPGRAAWLHAILARAELARGRREAAEQAVARARAVMRTVPLPLTGASVSQAEVLLALERGEPAEAARLAGDGVALADGVGAVVQAGRLRALAGRALGAAGDRDAALAELTRAEADLGACGAQRLRDEAARDLRRLGVRMTGRQRRGAGGDGLAALSGREREIAELVAVGRTNREIAATLFLAEKTVEGHLTNVFAKLGVASRAAVAGAVGRSAGAVE